MSSRNGLLDGKVAVVTGASSGIGRGIALAFAEQGAAVVVADRQAEPREGGTPTAEAITAGGGTATFARCDVTDGDDVDRALDAAEQLGGLDVLVNNAGILRPGPFLEFSMDAFDETMAVNVRAVFQACQAAARRMVAGRGGSIVNLSSYAGFQGSAGIAAYAASKGAVRLLTYALADELGPHGVRVNAIHPGLIDTAINHIDVPVLDEAGEPGDELRASIPLRRQAQPMEVGTAAVFLASDMASYVNGVSLPVDGGMFRS